jgi:phytoene/squalene synthetase
MRAVVLALMLLLLMASAPDAHADSARRLCARSALLRDSPEGFVIGRLYRPQRLRYLFRSANRRWALVRTRAGLAGWLPYRSLCHG